MWVRVGVPVGGDSVVGAIVVGAMVGEDEGAKTGPISVLHKLAALLSTGPQKIPKVWAVASMAKKVVPQEPSTFPPSV